MTDPLNLERLRFSGARIAGPLDFNGYRGRSAMRALAIGGTLTKQQREKSFPHRASLARFRRTASPHRRGWV